MTTQSFSVRNGHSAKPELQVQSMDTKLRNSLWNIVLARLFGKLACNFDGNITQEYHLFIALQKHFFRLPMDELERHLASRREWYKDHFMTMEWWQIYDLFEFVARRMIPFDLQEWERDTNETLARENSGYRLVGGSIVPCNDGIPLGAVQSTLNELRCFRDLDAIRQCEEHLKEALDALARRPQPDVGRCSEQCGQSIVLLLSHLLRSPATNHESQEPWSLLTAKQLALPNWMSHALALAFGTTRINSEQQNPIPLDEAEAWSLVTLAATSVRLMLARAMAVGWLPKREVTAPEPTIPDPWGERQLQKTT